MSGSFSSTPPRSRTSDDDGGILSQVRRTIDRLRAPEGLPGGTAPDRVDVRAAVLSVLAEQAASGYDIVRMLAARHSEGRAPRAGAVYPELQLLADEGLADASDVDGRTLYALTDAGRVAAEAARARRAPDDRAGRRAPAGRGGLAKAAAQLAQTAALVGQTGTEEQIADAVAELDAARRRLLEILTRD